MSRLNVQASLFDDITFSKGFDKPPLSFFGNKRNFKERFCSVLRDLDLEPDTLIVDLFGGSGYLSHLSACVYEQNEVIWNDFDDYESRLDLMKQTEKIYLKLSEIVGGMPKEQKLSENQMQKVKELLNKFESYDAMQVCSWLFVMGRRQGIEASNSMVNRLPKSFKAIDKTQYLRPNIKRVSLDFRELCRLVEPELNSRRVLFLADPPYINTDARQYKGSFTQSDLIELLDFLKDKDFIFFGNEKSDSQNYLQKALGHRDYFKFSSNLSLSYGRDGVASFKFGKQETNKDYMFVCVRGL